VELVEDGEESQEQLERYFNEKVVPMSVIPAGHVAGYRDAQPSPPRTRRAYAAVKDTAVSPLHGGKEEEDADGEGDDQSIDISI